MHNDTIETLLLRHYGSTAQAPDDLEETLGSLNTVGRSRVRERAAIHYTPERKTYKSSPCSPHRNH